MSSTNRCIHEIETHDVRPAETSRRAFQFVAPPRGACSLACSVACSDLLSRLLSPSSRFAAALNPNANSFGGEGDLQNCCTLQAAQIGLHACVRHETRFKRDDADSGPRRVIAVPPQYSLNLH